MPVNRPSVLIQRKLVPVYRRWIFCILTGLCILWLSNPSSAQVQQPFRFELELKYDDNYFEVVSAEDLGLLLVRKNEKTVQKGKAAWEYIVLDTTLHQRRADLIYIEYAYELIGYDFYRGNTYLLYQYPQNLNYDLLLINYNILTGEYTVHQVKRTLNIALKEFEIIEGSVILGGYVNQKPAVFQYFLSDGKTKVLPGFYMERTELLQIQVIDTLNVIRILTSLKMPDRNNSINSKTFTSKGEMIDNYNLHPETKISLMTARNVSVNPNLDILAGTYSIRNSDYSRGIFLASVDSTGKEKINYFSYGDLENFFSYMKAKRQQRVKDRIERNRIRGKKTKFNYRLLIHDIIETDKSYILLGEAYYPRYTNYSTYSYWANPYTPNSYPLTNFEGYKYTHAVVIGFDKKGRLLWDNSFEINDVTTYQLKKLVEVLPLKDRIVLLYQYENVIRTKIIKENDVLEGKSYNDITLKFEDDIVKDSESEVGGLNRWYDDKYYAFGVQKIKNDRVPESQQNREVFFINKIIYY